MNFSINGVPACGNEHLLTEVGRKELGFKGFYVSDAGAIENIFTWHRYVNSTLAAAALAANAGVDLELGSDPCYLQLYDAVVKGLVSFETILERVRKLFYVRLRLGDFDPPQLNPYESINISVVQSEAHRGLAFAAATKSFVLLKNDDNLLPLTEGTIQTLAVRFSLFYPEPPPLTSDTCGEQWHFIFRTIHRFLVIMLH